MVKAKRGKYREENFPVMKTTHSECHSTLCKQLTFDTTLTKFILVTPPLFSFISSYLKEKESQMKGKTRLGLERAATTEYYTSGRGNPRQQYQALQHACSWSFSMAHVGLYSPFILKTFKMLQDKLLLEKTRSQTAHFVTWRTAFTKAIITTEVPHTDSVHI
jgi:hypothetical protein